MTQIEQSFLLSVLWEEVNKAPLKVEDLPIGFILLLVKIQSYTVKRDAKEAVGQSRLEQYPS
jgi:hypothetical protein